MKAYKGSFLSSRELRSPRRPDPISSWVGKDKRSKSVRNSTSHLFFASMAIASIRNLNPGLLTTRQSGMLKRKDGDHLGINGAMRSENMKGGGLSKKLVCFMLWLRWAVGGLWETTSLGKSYPTSFELAIHQREHRHDAYDNVSTLVRPCNPLALQLACRAVAITRSTRCAENLTMALLAGHASQSLGHGQT